MNTQKRKFRKQVMAYLDEYTLPDEVRAKILSKLTAAYNQDQLSLDAAWIEVYEKYLSKY